MQIARCLMVQGTASSVGKSVLVTALCRILRQDGYRVAPFKAQNMALNSYVTMSGGEIGRAQAVQAEAAGIAPSVEMNPILLKPEADARSQVVIHGRPVGVVAASEYYRRKDKLWPVVVESLAHLRSEYEVVVIEGAGSPAEVNIKDGDLVNMRVALHARAPVLLVGDIDRGGVFASLLGTLELLEAEERAIVRGLVINKFRGDISLLQPGLRFLAERTGQPVLGVIPHFQDIHVSDEDSVVLDELPRGQPPATQMRASAPVVDVAVIRLPHISNFDDFDPMAREARVGVRYVSAPDELGRPALVIIPGTKTTLADLSWLRRCGLAEAVIGLAGRGTPVLGVCGGFQMLGQAVADPHGVEGTPGVAQGLGLLPVSTTFAREKTTCQVRGRVLASSGLLEGLSGIAVAGYEIHMGQTAGSGASPAFRILERSGREENASEGAVAEDGLILGTYLHGLFDGAEFRRAFLQRVAACNGLVLSFDRIVRSREDEYDRLAAHVRSHLDLDRVYRLIGC